MDPQPIRVRLTRLASENQNLRTPSVEGTTYQLPTIGCCMVVWGEPLDPQADIRMVKTSEIQAVYARQGQGQRFDTFNSQYLLEVLADM